MRFALFYQRDGCDSIAGILALDCELEFEFYLLIANANTIRSHSLGNYAGACLLDAFHDAMTMNRVSFANWFHSLLICSILRSSFICVGCVYWLALAEWNDDSLVGIESRLRISSENTIVN